MLGIVLTLIIIFSYLFTCYSGSSCSTSNWNSFICPAATASCSLCYSNSLKGSKCFATYLALYLNSGGDAFLYGLSTETTLTNYDYRNPIRDSELGIGEFCSLTVWSYLELPSAEGFCIWECDK